MLDFLESLNIECEHLDGVVETAAAEAASNVNNEGMSSQIAYLKENGYSEEGIFCLLYSELLSPGCTVSVTEPKHEHSQHIYAFEGTLIQVNDDCLLVRDMGDEEYEIEFDEISNFERVSTEESSDA